MEKMKTRTLSLLTLGLACALGIFGSVKFSNRQETVANAAVTETKRVWCSTVDVNAWWFVDSAKFMIHYYGGVADTTGEMVLDNANTIYYFDLPTDATTVQWYRDVSGTSYNWTNTIDFGTGTFYIHDYTSGDPAKQDVGYDGAGTHSTTTNVLNFAATIDTSAEACSLSAAQAAVNAYNAMPTFEQDQFDALVVSAGVTGLQRLQYLRNFYSISTVLNSNEMLMNSNGDNSLTTIVLIFISAVTVLGGFFLLRNKKTA